MISWRFSVKLLMHSLRGDAHLYQLILNGTIYLFTDTSRVDGLPIKERMASSFKRRWSPMHRNGYPYQLMLKGLFIIYLWRVHLSWGGWPPIHLGGYSHLYPPILEKNHVFYFSVYAFAFLFIKGFASPAPPVHWGRVTYTTLLWKGCLPVVLSIRNSSYLGKDGHPFVQEGMATHLSRKGWPPPAIDLEEYL